MYCTCENSKHNTAESYVNHDFFIHYLNAWNNDCSGSIPSQNKKKDVIFCWSIINKPQPNLYSGDTSIQGILNPVPRVSSEWRFHCILGAGNCCPVRELAYWSMLDWLTWPRIPVSLPTLQYRHVAIPRHGAMCPRPLIHSASQWALSPPSICQYILHPISSTWVFVRCLAHQNIKRGFHYTRFRYNRVLFHTFYCNFGQAEEYRSLYQGLCYIGVR